ncbi:MAG: ABC transporter substrate-binding protein [Armatimonadetes bacterium]|nr:ABC transporter substrate-binding protein [Armatimonadota bacterium]
MKAMDPAGAEKVSFTSAKSFMLVLLAALAVGFTSGCQSAANRQVPGRPLSAPAAERNWPRAFVDDLGQRAVLPRPPRRVVSLSPNMTEITCFVGAEEVLVGVTDFCDYPPSVVGKPKVGGIINASFEKILALAPDLVLAAQGNDLLLLNKLRQHGVPVYAAKPKTLENVFALISTVGKLLGRETAADAALKSLRARAQALQETASHLASRPRVLVVIEVDPLFVAGPGSFIDDLLRRAGLVNVVSEGQAWTRWSSERLIAADPDLVILAAAHEINGSSARRLKSLSPWRELRAVRQGTVYEVSDDALTIPGPRLVDGLANLVDVHSQYEKRSRAAPASRSAERQRSRGTRI